MTRLLPLLLAAVLVAGCGSDDKEKTASSKSEASPAPAATFAPGGISKDTKKEPQIPKPAGDAPTQLVTKDIVKGKGKAVKAGDTVSVQYTGVSFSTGEKFDASWDRGAEPFQFPVGGGQVIPGWDQGIPGMKLGGRRELVIPPDLAYGPAGQGSIGPNETLIFVVDLVKIG